MPIVKAPDPVVTKTGVTVTLSYCRKCMKMLPAKDFFECNDLGFIDANGLFSVCKECMQKIYDELFAANNSIEKTLHKMCTSLNVRFSNEAVDATKANIQTLLQGGKNVNSVFGIYKQKLIATNKSMDKSAAEDNTYEDIGTIYTTQAVDIKELPIPQDVLTFWGKDLKRDEIEYLENQYANFKQTHKADTYAEIVLLKEVCYTMLEIKKQRALTPPGDTAELIKELQGLMNSLAISPKSANASQSGKAMDTFGLWIQDIEREEPAEWLKSDPRGDMYRDVGNVEEYFQKYFVRPLKNAIGISKDFNIDDNEKENDDLELTAEDLNEKLIDDGELNKE